MATIRRIMVGVDGSGPATAALGWAARLAVATRADLVVASAWEPSQAEVSPDDVTRRRTEAVARLDDEWSAPARTLGAVPIPLLFDGSPDVMLQAADEVDADLVVVGSRGAGGFAALHLGSVAHHLTRHTTRPLAIVPAPAADCDPHVIVVGTDGSPGSLAAVEWCASVAPALGATVVAVLAFEPFIEWYPESHPKSWHRVAERNLADWVSPLRAVGVPVETVIDEDIHPVSALANTARRWSAQMIVVGTHGLGGFTKMRLGGVSVQLVHHLGLPVVLVPNINATTATSQASALAGA